MGKEKLCINCKHFLRHYVNAKGNFITTNCGHCRKRLISLNRFGKMIEDAKACELWESGGALKDKRKNRVQSEIARLANLLEDYVQLLKLDE